MASLISDRKGWLRVQFYLHGQRCRESLGERDNRENRRARARWLRALTAALAKPDFDYATWFPASRRARQAAVELESPLAPVTLAVYARRWLAGRELTAKVRRDYEYLFRVFLDRSALGAMAVKAVGKQDIREAIKGHSARRVTMFLQRLRSIMDEAIEDELREKNPAGRVKNPKPTPREPVEPFSAAEQLQLETVTGRDGWFISLALHTGMRPDEIVRIERKDIALKQRRMVVRGTKTTASARTIDLDDRAVAALREMLTAAALHRLFGKINFTNWRNRNWKRILAAMNIPYRKPYAMRHTYAIRMLEAGRDPVYVAAQLGHTSTQMLHRHYARWVNRAA